MTKFFNGSLWILGGLCFTLLSCERSDVSSAVNLPGEEASCYSAGCGSNDSSPDFGAPNNPEVYFAPSLMKAKSQDISYNRVECSGKDSGKVCVSICHRPPGNPANAKTKVLPLQAVFAHLNHGNPSQPDTLGTCDDPPMTDDGNEEPGDTPDDGDDTELPEWCEENLDIDSDCDGIGDGPGVPPTPIY